MQTEVETMAARLRSAEGELENAEQEIVQVRTQSINVYVCVHEQLGRAKVFVQPPDYTYPMSSV